MLWTVLVVLLILFLLGGIGGPYLHSGWQPGYGLGWYGNGGIGLVLIILILLILFGGGRF